MLRRNLAELERLSESTTTAEPKPFDPATRLEAALIEKRIERNARREVRASQLDPSQVIYSTLRPFPANDPEKALAWGNGAHAIAIYRHRQDIHDATNPLGAQPRGASARAERARARRRVDNARRQLARSAEQSVQRDPRLNAGIAH
jgi:hypothetical protein